jgi:hypothetical protein
MSDIQRLLALLQVDEYGEAIARRLNQALVDGRKRSLLLLKLEEIENSVQTLAQEITLTPSEAETIRMIQEARKPLTTLEITERAGGGAESLKYRQHASASLNGLVGKGLLGKVRGPGRQMYFTTAREAIKHAITQLGQSPDEYDPQAVADVTGLSAARVMEIVQEI